MTDTASDRSTNSSREATAQSLLLREGAGFGASRENPFAAAKIVPAQQQVGVPVERPEARADRMAPPSDQTGRKA